MTDLRKAAEQALEALEAHADIGIKSDRQIQALRQALAQSEQEPVAWVIEDGEVDYYTDVVAKIKPGTPLYTAPPKKEWVGLSDEERHDIREWQEIQKELGPVWAPMMLYLYVAIEAKLKEKNSG